MVFTARLTAGRKREFVATRPVMRYETGGGVVVKVRTVLPSSAWKPSTQHCCPAVDPEARGPTWIADCVAVQVTEMRCQAPLTDVTGPLRSRAMVMRTSGLP